MVFEKNVKKSIPALLTVINASEEKRLWIQNTNIVFFYWKSSRPDSNIILISKYFLNIALL